MLEEQPALKLGLTALFIGLTIAGVFIVGGMYACGNGGGVLSLKGYQCLEVEVVGVCEFEGAYYPTDQVAFNRYNVTLNLSGGFE